VRFYSFVIPISSSSCCRCCWSCFSVRRKHPFIFLLLYEYYYCSIVVHFQSKINFIALLDCENPKHWSSSMMESNSLRLFLGLKLFYYYDHCKNIVVRLLAGIKIIMFLIFSDYRSLKVLFKRKAAYHLLWDSINNILIIFIQSSSTADSTSSSFLCFVM